MKIEDKIDNSIKLAEFWYKLFNDRRNFEWKITLGLWGVIIATTNVLLDGHKSYSEVIFFAVFGTLATVLHFFWLKNIWGAHKKDKDTMFLFANEAGNITLPFIYNLHKKEEESKENKKYKDKTYWDDWSFRFQFMATVILVIGSIGLIALPFIPCILKLFVN